MKKTYLAIALGCLMSVIFLTTGVHRSEHVSAAAAALATTIPSDGPHEADTVLLTCMDFRLIEHQAEYMAHISKAEDYDYLILAGASLGVNQETYPEWGKTFWKHLELARGLHNIKNVMIIDHRNCGAYGLFLGKKFPEHPTPEELKEETIVHQKQLDKLAAKIHEEYPCLGIEKRLIALDGKVEDLGNDKGVGGFPPGFGKDEHGNYKSPQWPAKCLAK